MNQMVEMRDQQIQDAMMQLKVAGVIDQKMAGQDAEDERVFTKEQTALLNEAINNIYSILQDEF